jgi:hypothetical protein|tara:strand:- start:197 stop:646 length:450 start_codon:yes stop_codon:yes gene_type:complete
MVKRLLLFCLVLGLLTPNVAYTQDNTVLSVKKGDSVPFDGVLLSLDAAAKVLNDKRFSDDECNLRLEYELSLLKERYELQLDFKDIEITSWKDRYESMMILKAAENDRLTDLIMKQKPSQGPLWVALGFGIGTLTSLGIFALSTEIAKQ